MVTHLMTNRAFNSWRSIITHLSLSAPEKCNSLIKAKLVQKYTYVAKIMKLAFSLEHVKHLDFVRTYMRCVLNEMRT